MKIDKKTLEDLAIWDKNGGVLKLLDHCITSGGSYYLKSALQMPPQSYKELIAVQAAVNDSLQLIHAWPESMNNGMIIMVEKFFSATESIITKPNGFTVFIDKIVRTFVPRNEQSLVKFSITQVIDFVKALHHLVQAYKPVVQSTRLATVIEDIEKLLSNEYIDQLNNTDQDANYKTLLTSAYYTRRFLKSTCQQLIQHIHVLDYFRSLAIATQQNHWTMPTIISEGQRLTAQGLYHPLLIDPQGYDVNMNDEQNFIFITGANMSGKSTFMKSIGISAFLAHVGCGVPAHTMTVSFINALITNMQIEDNIYTGESYFLAEVLRMKNTALQIQNQSHNLVLMDELFKGTNIYDAYECTETVVKALIKNRKNMYCLSTHLYELGDTLQAYQDIQLRYFETLLTDDGHYKFSYQLKEGVSNDKIGYMVLKKEGVIDILNKS